jgi:Outer membrane protein beta-barrel domain
MEANNFEEHAKNIFDTFLIQPSDKVWNNIEASIQQKKAPAFYWIPTSFLLIGFVLSSLILHDLSTNNIFGSKHLGTLINNNTNRLQIPISTNKNVATSINNNIKNIHTKKELTHRHLHNTQSIATATINRACIKKITNNAINNIIESTSNNVAKQVNTLPIYTVLPSDNVSILNKIKDTVSAEEKNDIIGTNDILATTEANKKQPENTNEPVKQQQKKDKKWALNISMQAGTSIANKGFFSSTSSADYNGVNTTSGIGSPISTNAFSITLSPALAFSFGVQAQYYLTKKSSVAIGLQYNYASTIIKIKPLANSVSASTDASVIAVNNYQNQFHYIELPFNYCYAIFKNKKVKWQILLGGQVAQLVQTNAKQFNAVQGVFYTDNNLFSKTFMQASLAIYYNITNAKRGAWFIGPAFTYTVNALSNKGLYNQVHQNIVCINIKRNFTKK